MKQNKILQQYRNTIRFLQLVPDNVYFSLSPNEWYLPERTIQVVRNMLERLLNDYVMIYKRSVFDLTVQPDQHLCAHLKGVELAFWQVWCLKTFELVVWFAGVSFVVYQKPLTLQKIEDSIIHSFIKKRKETNE